MNDDDIDTVHSQFKKCSLPPSMDSKSKIIHLPFWAILKFHQQWKIVVPFIFGCFIVNLGLLISLINDLLIFHLFVIGKRSTTNKKKLLGN